MRWIIISFLLLGTTNSFLAQNAGYFGKKNTLDAAFNASIPLFSNLRQSATMLKYDNGQLAEHKDWIDVAYRFSYMRALSRRFGLGLEIGTEYISARRPNASIQMNTYPYYSANYIFEKIDILTTTVMPKLEFTNATGLLPMGLSHQFGIGINFSNMRDRDYHYQKLSDGSEANEEVKLITSAMKYTGGSVKSVTFMYQLNMRTPLTKFLFLNYGMRYMHNIMPSFDSYDSQVSSVTMSKSDFRNIVRNRRQYAFIQASLGLSFVF